MAHVDTLKEIISEIVNFGRKTVGSAVYGGKMRRPKKSVGRATMARRAGSNVVKALRTQRKNKEAFVRDAHARQEYSHKIDVEKQKQSYLRV